VWVGDDEAPERWRYRLAIGAGPTVAQERVERNGRALLERPAPEDERDAARLRQTHLEQVNVNREFRELAEFFLSIRYLHIVPQLVREPERSVGKHHDPFGGDFIEQVGATPARTRDARLRRIVKALRIAVPNLGELVFQRDPDGTAHLRGRYVHWRPQGAWHDEARLSDGTLRLLGLLWSLLEGSGPLLLEEPELSLHPGVARHIAPLVARMQRRTPRQVLLSTHSSDLLADEGIGLDEVLLLLPEREGTAVRLASDLSEVRELLEGGAQLSEAVLPVTRPRDARQLSLFDFQ
jgi:predicted ATPase